MAPGNKIFNDESSADIILKSSDAVSFHVHSDVLSCHSNIFADAGHYSANTADADRKVESVECTESSQTLDHLLRFMYRDERKPDVQKLEMSDLLALAEAVEKYDVWSVKQLLGICLRERLATHPLEIFQFAITHDYNTMALDAAVMSIGYPRKLKVPPVEILSQAALSRWSQLQQAIWATSKDLSLELGSAPMDVVAVRHANERYLTSSSWLQCSLWGRFETDINALFPLARHGYLKVMDLPALFEGGIEDTLNNCTICRNRAERWLSQYLDKKRALLHAEFGDPDKAILPPHED